MPGDMRDDGSASRTDLKGTAANPARDPKVMAMTDAEKQSVGYRAFRDAIGIVVIMWLIVLLTYFSLRNYTV